jgi:carbamate kinase
MESEEVQLYPPHNRHRFKSGLGAQTEGMSGYIIEQELENALQHDRPAATLQTRYWLTAQTRLFCIPASLSGRSTAKPRPSFAESGGLSGIGRLQDALAILEGTAGTRITLADSPSQH